MRLTLLAVLLRLLLFGYVPGLLLLCGFMGWVIWRLGQFYWLFPNVPLLLLIGALAATLGQVLWICRILFWRLSSEDPMELRLPRKRIQGLHELTVAVARRQQLPMPDHIRLSAESIAHIYEDDDRQSVLVIGGLAVRMFSQDALSGIIAHELAHVAGGDTRLSRCAFKRLLLMRILEEDFRGRLSRQLNPLIWLVRLYHGLFQIVWSANRRQQERAADQRTVELIGNEAAAAALIRITVTEQLPYVRLSAVAKSCVATGDSLEHIFAEQQERLRSIGAAEWRDALEKELRGGTDWFDSHPALRDRLQAVGVSAKKALQLVLADAGPSARELFADWDRIEQDLTTKIIAQYQQRQEDMMTFAQIIRGRP